jgi:DNA-binding NarL/FixJ family response regulator
MAWRSAQGNGPAVFLVDGWMGFRRSLRLFLEATGFRVVGEADTVKGARRADVVVLEPAQTWLDLERDLATLRSTAPGAGIVLLSSDDLTADIVFRAVESGVSAYLTKRDEPGQLLHAIEAALSRDFVLLPRHLLAKSAPHLAHSTTDASSGARLTRRELEVFALAAASYSDRLIANALWVTHQTVRFHLGNVYRKLGVKTRADAIAAAKRLGLLGWEGA